MILGRKDQMTKAGHHYFRTWNTLPFDYSYVRIGVGSYRLHSFRQVARRKKHPWVRFLSAIFTTFLSVTRHMRGTLCIRPGHKWRLREPVWPRKNFPRKKRVGDAISTHLVGSFEQKFQDFLIFALTLYYGRLKNCSLYRTQLLNSYTKINQSAKYSW